MAIVLTLGREVMQIICAYEPHSGRRDTKKVRFYDEMASESDLENFSKIIVFWGISMGMWGNVLRVLKVYTREMVLRNEMQKKEDCWSFAMKNSCALQTFGLIRRTKGKSLIVPMDVEQKLILCFWEKHTESM